MLRNASSGTYEDLPAPAFMVLVFLAPSAAADAAACSAAATLPPEESEGHQQITHIHEPSNQQLSSSGITSMVEAHQHVPVSISQACGN